MYAKGFEIEVEPEEVTDEPEEAEDVEETEKDTDAVPDTTNARNEVISTGLIMGGEDADHVPASDDQTTSTGYQTGIVSMNVTPLAGYSLGSLAVLKGMNLRKRKNRH